MTLRYDRLKQEPTSGFRRANRSTRAKPMAVTVSANTGCCAADEYEVQTWREGSLATFVVGTESGPSPFVLRNEKLGQKTGSGTRLALAFALVPRCR